MNTVRKIPEYEKYTISEKGTVMRDGFVLIPFVTKKGYKVVTLCKNGTQKKFYNHYLVYITFVGSIRSNEIIIFIDKDKDNTSPTNLKLKVIKNARRKNL